MKVIIEKDVEVALIANHITVLERRFLRSLLYRNN